MKKRAFLSILFASLALVFVVSATAQPPQGGQGRGAQGTPEEMSKMMVERMDKNLDLTDEQETAIYDINLKYAEARNSSKESRPSREEMEGTRDKMNAEIKAVLTDDQKAKFEEMQSKMKERDPRK